MKRAAILICRFFGFLCLFLGPSNAAWTAQLEQSINPQEYAAVSSEVVKTANGKLIFYGGRSVTYDFMALKSGDYLLRFSTAQASRQNIPSPDYKFRFDVSVDKEKKLSDVELPAGKEYAFSDFLPLGSLPAGNHTLTLQWTNDVRGENYDTNVGIGSIEIHRA